MSDSDSTFGSGLNPGAIMSGAALNIGGAQSAPAAESGSDVQPPPQPAPAPQQPPQPPAQSQSFFGSGLKYNVDQNADPLDQSASLLQQRIQRASAIASDPLKQFFDPAGVQKAREAVPVMTQQLQQIRGQQVQRQNNDKMGANYGIDNIPQGADKEQATEYVTDELQKRYLNGDPTAAQALLQLGRQDLVQGGHEQALSAAADNIKRYRDVYSKLSNMQNAGQYNAAYNELQQQTADGVHQDHEMAWVPKTYDEFQKKKQQMANSLATQQLEIDSRRAQMAQLGGVVPIQKQTDKDGNAVGLHAAISSQITDENGNTIKAEPVTVGGIYNGNRLPYGSQDIGAAGNKWGAMDKGEVAEVQKRIEPHKQSFERAAGINKLNDITSQKDFGTNAWLLGHGIDQFVEISRNGVGGKGSATPGTINIMEHLRGALQTYGDTATKEWGRMVDWIDGGRKGPQPYMSATTINGLKAAVQTLKTASDKETGGEGESIAQYVGRHGGKLSDMGLEPAVAENLRPSYEQGLQSFKQDIASRPSVVMGGQRIVFDRAGVAPPTAVTPGGFDKSAPGVRTSGAPSPSGTSGAPPVGPQGPNPSTGAGPQPQVPTGGPTPGRYGVPPGMKLDTPQAREAAANRQIQLESGFKPGQSSGAYSGLGQWSKAEMQRHGITDPDDVGQTRGAMMADIETRAAKLQKDGLPVTGANVYLMHQQGEAGLEAHLRNPDGVAWQNVRQYYKSDDVAKKAVWGNMTPQMRAQFPGGVDTVTSGAFTKAWEARYNGTDNPQGAGVANVENRRTGLASNPRTAPRAEAAPVDTSNLPDVGAAPWTGRTTPTEAIGHWNTPQERASSPMVNNAPAIGSTIGAMGGSLVAPGPGSVAGGAAGGAAGQAFQDWMQGRDQDPGKIAKQAALGGVLGVTGTGAAATAVRVGGAAAVEGVDTLARGGDTSDALQSAGEGGAYALGGEVLSRFLSALGPTAHRVLSNYNDSAQKQVSEMAGKLSEARKTLETEEPKLAGGADGAAKPNPKYEAAKATEEAATEFMKQHNQNPDDMVYAYDQAKEGVSAGEAFTMRGANKERADVRQGYNDLRQQFQDTGVGTPKPNQPVPDGPVSQLRTSGNPTGSVPEKFRPEAEHAEMLVKAPAPQGWGQKWQQLQDAGSELIQKRMDFLQAGDKSSAEAMDGLFKGVRNQQKAAAEYVFGPERGAEIIKNLESLDQRYAKVMNATAGMDYKKMRGILAGGNTPEARELEKNFTEFNKGDPSAMRMFNALKAGARGDWASEAKLMIPVIAGEVAANASGVPTMGAVSAAVGGYRLYKLAQGFMNAKLLGKVTTFKDFMQQNMPTGLSSAIGGVQQRGSLMQSPQQ